MAALRWADVGRSKTNQAGEQPDIRRLDGGCAAAVRRLHAATTPEPADPVIGLGGDQINRRFAAACAAASLEGRRTSHGGRGGLATELTARGASAHDVMRAGNWKTIRMVAHYSAGASAERGAVARYL